MLQTLSEINYKGEDLWIEFTTAFRPSAIRLLTGTQQSSWVRILTSNGFKVTQRRGFPKWKALKECLLAETFPVGVILSPTPSRQRERSIPQVPTGNQVTSNVVPPQTESNQRGRNINTNSDQNRRTLPTADNTVNPNPMVRDNVLRFNTRGDNDNRGTNANRDHHLGGNSSFEIGQTGNRPGYSAPTREIRGSNSNNRNEMNNNHNSRRSNDVNINNIQSIMKSYQGRTKFKGNFDEDFEGSLEQFETFSQVYQLTEEEKARAFPFMIDEGALSHFTNTFSKRNYTYQEVIEDFRNWYTSEEQRSRLLLLWQKPSLTDAMRQDPERSELEVFRKLVDKLTSIQRQLHPSYREDRFLRDQLIIAADINQLSNSLREKIPKSAQEAINRIASQLSSDPKSAGAHFIEDCDEANYVLGRRFGGQARRDIPRSGRKQREKSSLRKDLANVRGCWVCGNKHRAIDYHTRKQVLDAVNKFRNSKRASAFNAQHLDDFEWALYNDNSESDSSSNHEEDVKDHNNSDSGNLADVAEVHKEAIAFFTNASYLHGIHALNIDKTQPIQEITTMLCTSEYIHEPGSTEIALLANHPTFDGIIIDTGANRSSVMFLNQYRIYCKIFKTPMQINHEDSKGIKGLFGGSSSIGTAIIPIPFVKLDVVLDIKFLIMKSDCKTLFCLKDLKDNGLNLDVQRDMIQLGDKEQKLLLENDFQKHIWSPSDMPYILYTESELRRLHRNFGHPTVSALKKVLKRANPETCDKKTKTAIAEIVQSCKTCQKYASRPRRFKLTIGANDLIFNHVLAVDIMYINGKPILHVVDEATHYMSALFLRKVSSEETWKAIQRCWIRVYLGPPDNIRVDQGSNFVSQHFRNCTNSEGIQLLEAPVESPSTMTHVERYHAPLRSAYLKIRSDLPRTESDADCLQMAVKSVNDTVGPEGLCPTLLVYGSIPRPARQTPADTQLARAHAMDKARDEVLKEMSKKKVAFGLRTSGLPVSNEQEQELIKLPAGSPVLIYRNADKKWEGPFPFISIDGNTVVVQLPRGRKIFRSNAVKPAVPSNLSLEEASLHNLIDSKQENDRENTVLNIASSENQCIDSRRKEIQGLMDNGVFHIVRRSTVPLGARIYGTKWVDTIKTQPNLPNRMKSRLVAQNYRDRNAANILTKSPTISRLGQRIALVTAALFPTHQAYVRDISQAYIQSNTTLERNVYLKPPPEMELHDNYVLLAKKPLYGIPESGLHWFLTYQKHHTLELSMKETTYDKCLFYTSHSDKNYKGVTALQVDDSFGHGTELFLKEEEEKCKRYQHYNEKPRVYVKPNAPVPFNGTIITRLGDGNYKMDQSQKLKDIKYATSDEDLVSIRALLQYIGTCTRPDLCSVSQMLATDVLHPSPRVHRKLNKLVRWATDTIHTGLNFINLNMNKLAIKLFTDSSFANNQDHKSQLGYVVILADDHNKANIHHYGSTKCQRVTRSVLASELHGLIHGFDQANIVQNILQEILDCSIPIDVHIDSRTLFNVVSRYGETKEKRLQIDASSLRQSYDSGEIRNIFWISGHQNYADALTKSLIRPNHCLWRLMHNNKLEITPHGWNKQTSNPHHTTKRMERKGVSVNIPN